MSAVSPSPGDDVRRSIPFLAALGALIAAAVVDLATPRAGAAHMTGFALCPPQVSLTTGMEAESQPSAGINFQPKIRKVFLPYGLSYGLSGTAGTASSASTSVSGQTPPAGLPHIDLLPLVEPSMYLRVTVERFDLPQFTTLLLDPPRSC
jgi:hypothetical protein